jgi:hypothetical protein
MPFFSDLSFGKSYETLASSRLPVGETLVEFAPAGCKGWDFRSDKFKYEVKADRLAYKYDMKTMFIEFECSGKPSGISTTEADIWVYFMVRPNGTSRVFWIPVSALKDACSRSQSKCGGDGGRARGYIVSVGEFEGCECESPPTSPRSC